ncbi:hypothetical protein CBR_g8042 [Chara braunii]|uniref:UBA domain-containing protein n=1 Tax=Chara braunii TaxID=69332 RepID=A0A388KL24_CHABU|nr:hypothetical protein CBR_g8042 [Chara braunii]|eukprot:GBG70745.1 hypothetical protein CBR_g8042 [Chara braunii]
MVEGLMAAGYLPTTVMNALQQVGHDAEKLMRHLCSQMYPESMRLEAEEIAWREYTNRERIRGGGGGGGGGGGSGAAAKGKAPESSMSRRMAMRPMLEQMRREELQRLQLQAVVGVLVGQMQKGSKVDVGEMKLDEWLEARGQDMLEILWELEEGPDPRFEAYLDWRRLDAKMLVCQALFREGRDLHWRMEEWLEEDDIGVDGGLPLVHSPAGRVGGTVVSADQPGITEGANTTRCTLVKGTTATSSPIPPTSAATAQGLTRITAEIPSQTTEAVLMEVLELGVAKMTTLTEAKMTTSTTMITITTATVTPTTTTTTLTAENSITTDGGKGVGSEDIDKGINRVNINDIMVRAPVVNAHCGRRLWVQNSAPLRRDAGERLHNVRMGGMWEGLRQCDDATDDYFNEKQHSVGEQQRDHQKQHCDVEQQREPAVQVSGHSGTRYIVTIPVAIERVQGAGKLQIEVSPDGLYPFMPPEVMLYKNDFLPFASIAAATIDLNREARKFKGKPMIAELRKWIQEKAERSITSANQRRTAMRSMIKLKIPAKEENSSKGKTKRR